MEVVHFIGQSKLALPGFIINLEMFKGMGPVDQIEEGTIPFGIDLWILLRIQFMYFHISCLQCFGEGYAVTVVEAQTTQVHVFMYF